METAGLEEWNRGNPTPYLEIYSADFTYFDPMIPKRSDDFEAIKEMYEALRGKGSVDRYEMIDTVVQIGDGMAVLTYWKIIHNHWSITQPFGENM